MLNNHSPLPEDWTARARIRDEALRLFAERGPDAGTVRDIASAVGVSPALLARHYGSKEGSVGTVDNHVVGPSIPMTSLRRLISLLSRSSGLVL